MLYALGVVLALAWAAAVRDHPEYGWQDPAKYALYTGIGVTLILGGYAFLLWYVRPTVARMSAAIGQKRGALAPTRFRLTPGRIELETGGRTGNVPWEQVSGAYRTELHLFLLFTGLNGFIVPARCFDTSGEFDAFADAAEQFHHALKT